MLVSIRSLAPFAEFKEVMRCSEYYFIVMVMVMVEAIAIAVVSIINLKKFVFIKALISLDHYCHLYSSFLQYPSSLARFSHLHFVDLNSLMLYFSDYCFFLQCNHRLNHRQ